MRLQRGLFLLCTFIATATVAVTPSMTGVSMNVSPTSASVQAGAKHQFTATVTGSANTTVVWTVNNVVNGSATMGTISNSGLYTAPAVVPSRAVAVKATSLADTHKSATALVTVTGEPPISASANLASANQNLLRGKPAIVLATNDAMWVAEQPRITGSPLFGWQGL